MTGGSNRLLRSNYRRSTGNSLGLLIIYLFNILMQTVGYFLAMISDSQVYVLNPGETAVLECNFHADSYNLFDYPVLWQKSQLAEQSHVNMMSNINEPFLDTNRFDVSFSAVPPRYKFLLSILDVSLIDSGNYTCEIRGQNSIILGQSTNYLFIRAPVESIFLTDGLDSPPHDDTGHPRPPTQQSSSDQKILRLAENHPSRLGCHCIGGYPPPVLNIFVGQRDVTDLFMFSNPVTMSGQIGLRLMTYETRRWTAAFVARADDDDTLIRCVATVPGFEPFVAQAMLDVAYSPKIHCSPSSAFIADKNVNVDCRVRAKPQTSSIFWVIDGNGSKVTDGKETNGMWTVVTDRTDGVTEVQLYFSVVTPALFRKYTIVAENVVGVTNLDTELFQKYRKVPTEPLADASFGHVNSRVTSDTNDTRRPSYIKKSPVNIVSGRSTSSDADVIRADVFLRTTGCCYILLILLRRMNDK